MPTRASFSCPSDISLPPCVSGKHSASTLYITTLNLPFQTTNNPWPWPQRTPHHPTPVLLLSPQQHSLDPCDILQYSDFSLVSKRLIPLRPDRLPSFLLLSCFLLCRISSNPCQPLLVHSTLAHNHSVSHHPLKLSNKDEHFICSLD